MKIKDKIIAVLSMLVWADDYATAVQLSRGTRVKLSSLSSVLLRMIKKGEIVRVHNIGPRGGYGYRLKTTTEVITDVICKRSVKELCEQIDAEILRELGIV